MKRLKTIATIVITAIVTFGVTMAWVLAGKHEFKSISNNLNNDMYAAKLRIIEEKIKKDYHGDKYDENWLKELALAGYVAGLNDPYSMYFPKEMNTDLKREIDGNYVGIGVLIMNDVKRNGALVMGCYAGTPAEKAGLKKGDLIVAVNSKTYNKDNLSELANDIQGKVGSKIKLKVISEDGKERTVEVQREKIEIINYQSLILKGNIGYIRIESFDGNVAKNVKKTIEDMEEKNVKAYIIDLRDNPGGLLDQALEVGDLFTDKGQVMLYEKSNTSEKVERAKTKKLVEDKKVVVLTNKATASAAEILTAIIKENYNNSISIGAKTFGKGVIQTVYQLPDQTSFKLTTAEYLTPHKNKINKIGIDVDIKMDDDKNENELPNTNMTKTLTESDLESDKVVERAIQEINK